MINIVRNLPDGLFPLGFTHFRLLVSLGQNLSQWGSSDGSLKLHRTTRALLRHLFLLRGKSFIYITSKTFSFTHTYKLASFKQRWPRESRSSKLTDWPFLCLRLYRTVQLICRGFLLDRKADSHFAFRNWKTCHPQNKCRRIKHPDVLNHITTSTPKLMLAKC